MFLKNFSKKKKINKWNFNGPENINSSCRFFLNQITSQNGWRQCILEEFFNMSAWCVCANIWNISTLLRGIGICLHCFSPLMLLYFNFCDVVGNLIEGLYSVNVFVELSVWPFERHCNFIDYIWCINMTCTTDGDLFRTCYCKEICGRCHIWNYGGGWSYMCA